MTDKISLRRFRDEDAPALLNLLGDSGQGVLKPSTLDGAKDWIKKFPYDVFAIDRGGSLVGEIHLEVRPWFSLAELGYTTKKELEGQGIATEAVKEILKYGFLELSLNRIFATTTAKNMGSVRVLEKSGFIHEATLKEARKVSTGYEDELVFRLLFSEWQGE